MNEADITPPHAFERLVFFSDAVFAIVITLLVLPLTAEIELPDTPQEWSPLVWDLRAQVLTFVIGFIVIGQFWMAHHSVFGRLRSYDGGLLWLNLLILLTVCFLPFPTSVLGADSLPGDHFPAVFYAASLSATSVAMTVTWLYAVRRGLVDPNLTPSQVREGTVRSLVTSGVFVLSIGAAFLGLALAVAFWAVLPQVARALAVRASAAG